MRIVLMYSTHRPSDGHLQGLSSLAPSAEVVVAQDEHHAIDACRDADIILGHRYLYQVLPTAKKLAFVQSTAAGVDRLPLEALAKMGVRLCRCTIASPTIARHAVTCAWAITRQLPEAFARQRRQAWDNAFDWPRQPSRALVVGAGAIGKAIAQMLSRDGIEVVGIRGSSNREPIEGFSKIHGPSALVELLPTAQWCFLAMPLNTQTHGLFDQEMLERLPHDGVLVNVARGEVVDTDALCRLMHQGHLAGAALDVLPPEAKSPEHAVWSTPRIMVTPHTASHCAERPEQIEAFVERQVRAFLSQQPMQDEVDRRQMVGC